MEKNRKAQDWRRNKWKEEQTTTTTKPRVLTDDRMMKRNTEGYVFTIEKVVRSVSEVVDSIDADGWTELQAEMCRETNSICSPSRQRGWQHYRVRIGDTAPPTMCPEEESLFVLQFIFFRPPRKAGDKAVAVGGSKGRVPGSDTHTHQNTSSVLQTSL